jgi:hypothetical protein
MLIANVSSEKFQRLPRQLLQRRNDWYKVGIHTSLISNHETILKQRACVRASLAKKREVVAVLLSRRRSSSPQVLRYSVSRLVKYAPYSRAIHLGSLPRIVPSENAPCGIVPQPRHKSATLRHNTGGDGRYKIPCRQQPPHQRRVVHPRYEHGNDTPSLILAPARSAHFERLYIDFCAHPAGVDIPYRRFRLVYPNGRSFFNAIKVWACRWYPCEIMKTFADPPTGRLRMNL